MNARLGVTTAVGALALLVAAALVVGDGIQRLWHALAGRPLDRSVVRCRP